MAKNEVIDRDLAVQIEKYKNFSVVKQDYIKKLKDSLLTVESRFSKLLNKNAMVGEDYRSQAFHNMTKYLALKK